MPITKIILIGTPYEFWYINYGYSVFCQRVVLNVSSALRVDNYTGNV